MSDFHLAQFNIGRLLRPLDDPGSAGFTTALDPINALAERSPGFVWRFTGEGANDATGVRPYEDDQVALNLSVWEGRDQLWDFAYRSGHMELLRRRREWFETAGGACLVLWWIPAGTVPAVEEAMARLELLRERGPSPEAFTFRRFFGPPADQATA